MSWTITNECPIVTATLLDSQYQSIYHMYRDQFVTIGLLAGLYGVLNILSMISIYALIKQQGGRIQLTPVLLCLTILAFFLSTTLYVVTCIIYYHSNLMSDFLSAGVSLWDFGRYNYYMQWNLPSESGWLTAMQACASSSALTVNVALGDAIVCWRACVVWDKNRAVKAICSTFLLATVVLGVIDTKTTCQRSPMEMENIGVTAKIRGGLFEGIPIGLATCVLSLSTNILATVFIASKVWQSRRRLRGYLVAKVGGSQVEKLLTLLIESGAIYSAIWVDQYLYANLLWSLPGNNSILDAHFINYFSIIMNGVLVPAIAIYPTIIIVLVALNKSFMKMGISQHLESIPTPHLTIAVDTTTTNLDESRARRRSEILVIGQAELVCGGALELDEERGTNEKWKSEGSSDADQLPLNM